MNSSSGDFEPMYMVKWPATQRQCFEEDKQDFRISSLLFSEMLVEPVRVLRAPAPGISPHSRKSSASTCHRQRPCHPLHLRALQGSDRNVTRNRVVSSGKLELQYVSGAPLNLLRRPLCFLESHRKKTKKVPVFRMQEIGCVVRLACGCERMNRRCVMRQSVFS